MVRYLKWLSIPAKVFNVGNYRRTATPQPNAAFFDTSNKEGERLRKAAAEAAVADMVKWFKKPDNLIAILDATNSTKATKTLDAKTVSGDHSPAFRVFVCTHIPFLRALPRPRRGR